MVMLVAIKFYWTEAKIIKIFACSKYGEKEPKAYST